MFAFGAPGVMVFPIALVAGRKVATVPPPAIAMPVSLPKIDVCANRIVARAPLTDIVADVSDNFIAGSSRCSRVSVDICNFHKNLNL